MSTTVDSSQLIVEKKSELDQLCSKCGSAAHFACIQHCKAALCARCASRHHVIIIQHMHRLLKQLKMYRIESVNFHNVSKTSFIQTSDTLKENLDNSINSNLTTVVNDPGQDYIKILEEHLEKDRLLDGKILADLDAYLSDRTVGIIKSVSSSMMISRNLNAKTRLRRRTLIRSQTANVTWTKTITSSLTIQKHFQISNEPSFSVNEYPIAVSLNDHYSETFFCQWEDNSIILLSTCAIDIFTRGSGLTWSIPFDQILGNVKDKIIAGTWCSYIHRLVLVGRYYFYFYDLDRQKVRSLCDCGCGGCCGNRAMPPKGDQFTRLRFRCPPFYDNYPNSQRFLVCNRNEYLFYAYRSGKDTYQLEIYAVTQILDLMDEERETQSSAQITGRKEMKPISSLSITGQLAAICVTNNRLAVVYRRLREKKKSIPSWKNPAEFDHYFALFDHSLTKLTEDALLLSSIRWVTALVSFGTEYEYLVCDPLGEQLLLYQAINGIPIHRFHIGCVNACCLTDGRLVLWVRKSYANSPTAKLHFINASHLEKYRMETKSLEVSKESHI